MTTDHSNTVGILTDKLGKTACTNCGVELDISDYDLFERILCPQCDVEQVVPAKLGNFLLVDQLGIGGMGAVYLAQDQRLRRRVALKVMRAEYGRNTKFYEDFQTEAQATARLNHANIVQVYSLGEENGQPYIVMELLDGDRMDDMMDNNTQVDEEVVLHIADDVTRGLAAASEAGIIHGDIKPANILMDTKGTAKVVDFGLARFAEIAAEASGEIWGTPFYIAPEKARKKPEDFRSDQYSLGATLWHALAGEPPFDGETPSDVVVARFKSPVPDVREYNASVSEKTAHLLIRMMAKDPHRRYPTYDSLLADLAEARKELLSSRVEDVTPAKSRHTLWIGLGVAALIVVGAVAVSLKGGDKGSSIQAAEEGVYTVLRKGRPVRVKASDLNAQERANMGLEATPVAVPHGDVSPRSGGNLVSLTDTKTGWLEKAARACAVGDAFEADMQLGKILRTVPSTKAAHHYALLYQSINHILNDDAALAREALKQVRDAKLGLPEGSTVKELPMPLASFLLGEMSGAELKLRLDASADWYKHLGGLVQGVNLLRQKKLEGIPALMHPYVSPLTREPRWAYAWQPVAKQLLEELALIEKLKLDPTTGGGRTVVLRDMFLVWGGLLPPVSMTASQPAQVAVKAQVLPTPKPAPTATPVPQPAVDAKILADYSLMKKTFISLKPLVFLGQYGEASSKIGVLSTQVTTAKGKALVHEFRKGLGCQKRLVDWLGQQVKSVPYEGPDLKAGKPIMVAVQGVGFVDKKSVRVKLSFEEMDGLDFLKMGSWYLNNGEIGQGKMGEYMLGLGLYSIQYGGIKYAGELILSAGDMDSSLVARYPNLYYTLTHPEL